MSRTLEDSREVSGNAGGPAGLERSHDAALEPDGIRAGLSFHATACQCTFVTADQVSMNPDTAVVAEGAG